VDIILEGNGSHFDPLMIESFKAVTDEFKAIAVKYSDEE
jgi:response regulator RpfG family c-di-GMP phosphodiesterase